MKANTEFTDISDVEKHRKGMSRLYFLRKLRSFSVCTKMMRAGTLHPVVERTWRCCSMTDTGHTGHTGQAAELLFKQTGSVLLPQTQRQKTFTPHAANIIQYICHRDQHVTCYHLQHNLNHIEVTVTVIRHYKQSGVITMMMISATVSASCFIFILLRVSDVSPRDGHFWAFP